VLDENDETGYGFLISGFVVDDTDRNLTETTLSQTDKRYQSIVQRSQEIMTGRDEDGRCGILKVEAPRSYGQPQERLLGRRPSELAHPEDRPKENAARRYVAATGQPVHRVEFPTDRLTN